jgi:histidinol-phosphate aminotransferase
MGFAIGAAPVVERLERVTGPYDINSFAVTAAFAALKDQAYVDGYVAEVLGAKAWLEAQLRATTVRHHSAGGNYLLIWPKLGVAAMETGLRQRGILVRSMAGKPLLDGALRVSVGTLNQMQQFWAAYGSLEGLTGPLEET